MEDKSYSEIDGNWSPCGTKRRIMMEKKAVAKEVTKKVAEKTATVKDVAGKVVKEAPKAVEKAVKEAPKAVEKAVKEAPKAAEKVAKEAPKKVAKAAKTVKKETEKATKTVKAAAKKVTAKASVQANINIQFAGKSYTTEELVNIAKDVWKYDLNQKVEDFKTVDLYVKPEEHQAYYVINEKFTGSFFI